MGNVNNMMLQSYVTLAGGLTCFKKTCKTFGYIEIIVFNASPWGSKPYISHDLMKLHRGRLLKWDICTFNKNEDNLHNSQQVP